MISSASPVMVTQAPYGGHQNSTVAPSFASRLAHVEPIGPGNRTTTHGPGPRRHVWSGITTGRPFTYTVVSLTPIKSHGPAR
jgi:hypothetical protein